MSTVFAFLLLIAVGCLILGLISPMHLARTARVNKVVTRKHISFGGLVLIVFLCILISITAPKPQSLNSTSTAVRTQTPTQPAAPDKPASVTTTKQITQTIPINFTTTNENDASLAQGQTHVSQTGQNGIETDTYSVTETSGKQVAQTLVSKSVTTEPINQVEQVGTYVAPAPPAPTPQPVAASTQSSAPASAGCTPLTNGGNCYEPGEYCRTTDHGASGTAGDGESITCLDNDGWRWEPS